MKNSTIAYVNELINRYPSLESIEESICNAIEMLIATYHNGDKLLICGNGGSAADSLHIVGELMKSFVKKRPVNDEIKSHLLKYEDGEELADKLQCPLPAISLVCESGLSTAFENDVEPAFVFAQQVLGYGRKGDCLLAISTSGNSRNVIAAAEVAKAMGIHVLGLTGKTGGKLRSIADVLLAVPETETYKVQELHLPIYHAICLAVENEFWGEID
ncbi:SIS domain-containing protein [uncultured Dialister sp.]|uniref:D-sedoheptulose-7-phosphate isomerase n=1 Tax=uncultured Dialister sp. TaxID=278064 RepID=UPI00266EEAC7|nr:SIS domain-containing protein [uncultured Dialister sp.]